MKRLILTGTMIMALAACSVLAASNENTPAKSAKSIAAQGAPAAKTAPKPAAKRHRKRHHRRNKSTGTTSSQPKGGTKK